MLRTEEHLRRPEALAVRSQTATLGKTASSSTRILTNPPNKRFPVSDTAAPDETIVSIVLTVAFAETLKNCIL